MSRTNQRRFIAAINVISLLLLFTACLSNPVADRTAAETAYYTLPVRIILLADKTGSSGVNRVEQPEVDDLDPIFDLLSRVSGEVAIGLISDDSNRTLLRLRVDLPPAPPEAPAEDINVYIRADLLDEYEEAMTTYEAELDDWDSETRSRIGAFREEARALLARPADAPHTDVFGALRRAGWFLDEPTPRWGETSRFIVLISDGDDNVHGDPVEPSPGTHVAIVNGAGTLGDLSHLQPVRFESVEAALRWVVATAESSTVAIEGA